MTLLLERERNAGEASKRRSFHACFSSPFIALTRIDRLGQKFDPRFPDCCDESNAIFPRQLAKPAVHRCLRPHKELAKPPLRNDDLTKDIDMSAAAKFGTWGEFGKLNKQAVKVRGRICPTWFERSRPSWGASLL